jgi:hypothetical protein
VDRSTGAGSVVVVAVVVVVVVAVVGATVVVVDVVVVGGTVVVVVVLLVVEDEAVVVAGSVVVLYDMSVVDDSTTSVEVTSGRSADWVELAHDALTITTPIRIPIRTTAVQTISTDPFANPPSPSCPCSKRFPSCQGPSPLATRQPLGERCGMCRPAQLITARGPVKKISFVDAVMTDAIDDRATTRCWHRDCDLALRDSGTHRDPSI